MQHERSKLTALLREIMGKPTGRTTAGYPYLERQAWEQFRDGVPHLFGMGAMVLRMTKELAHADAEFADAAKVIQQVVFTATITAPPDLWLLRHVVGAFAELGLSQRLLDGQAIYPEWCQAKGQVLKASALEVDLHFLLARGLVDQYDNSFRIAGHPEARRIFEQMGPLDHSKPESMTRAWSGAFQGLRQAPEVRQALIAIGTDVPVRDHLTQTHWIPTLEEIELGYRLVPLVLGMKAADAVDIAGELDLADPIHAAAIAIFEAAGWLEDGVVTTMGSRGLGRGPGPFGIIEAYNPYMTHAVQLLLGQDEDVWVERSENVGASQDANRATFMRANDALDRFCEDTGFTFDVFVEHAIGRGEATRQRYQRSGGDIQFFGADLEDPAIDAAIEQQKLGVLPANMVFVRQADIGKPEILTQAIQANGASTQGAVMLVGNGFHEVRSQSDKRMIDVFRGYHDAGMILVFTEENALSIDDLRATAFNTYHAGFKYVHEKSGQGLRPADPRPIPRLGQPLRAPWSQCATQAGYVRLEAYGYRSRTIYPYTPRTGHNPSISVTHFMVPAAIAAKLGLN